MWHGAWVGRAWVGRRSPSWDLLPSDPKGTWDSTSGLHINSSLGNDLRSLSPSQVASLDVQPPTVAGRGALLPEPTLNVNSPPASGSAGILLQEKTENVIQTQHRFLILVSGSFLSEPKASAPCTLTWEAGSDLYGPAGPTGGQGRLTVPLDRHLPTQGHPAAPRCTTAEQPLAAFAQGVVKKYRVPSLILHRPGMGQGTSILNKLSMVARGHYIWHPSV